MITIDRKEFLKELEWISRFVYPRTSIPVLGAVQIKAENETLTLEATDLEVSGFAALPTTTAQAGQAIIPTKRLVNYLKKVEEAEIHLSFTGTAQYPNLRLTHGADGEVEITGFGANTFPEICPATTQEGTIDGLLEAIPRILTSISAEESRFTLNGALLEVTDVEARLISTDGNRLALCDIYTTLPAQRRIIRKKALIEWGHLVGDQAYRIGVDEKHLTLFVGNRSITSRHIEGQFPDYEKVLPNSLEYTSFELPTKPLQKILERVAIFADERSRATRWELQPNGLKVWTQLSETGKAQGLLPVKVPDQSWMTGLNADYMLDGLKLMPPTFDLHIRNNDSMIEARGGGFRYLVMPMRT